MEADGAGVGSVVLPGDVLRDLKQSESTGKTVLGPGIRRDSDDIIVTKAGILKHKDPNFYWVDCPQRRYIPVRGESVIGVVTQRAGDVFKVDVGASEPASLSYLAFEGATKRNRPDVKIGDLIYAKFLVANKDMEPELVCIDGTGRANGMGVIRDGGFMFRTSLGLVRKILSSECVLLKTVGNLLPYEIAVGMNGRIWVKGRSIPETIAISNAICSAEFMTNSQVKVMARRVVDALANN